MKTTFKVGQRAQYVGVQFGKKCNFPVVIREINPHGEWYAVDAVFADNVGYTPDNWCSLRDLEVEPVYTDCCHCDGGKIKWGGYDGNGTCYCGNTGKLKISGPGSCCTCGEIGDKCRCEV